MINKLLDVNKLLDIIKKYKWYIITLMFISMMIFISLIVYFYKIYVSKNEIKENYTNNEAKLIMFHVDWCPHCKRAIPDWNSFKSEFNNLTCNNTPLKIIDYDVTEATPENKKLLKKYNVKGYPTIILDKNGQVKELEVKPTKDNLEAFIKENC